MNDKKFFINLDKDLIKEQNRQNAEAIFKNPWKKRIQETDFKDIFGSEEVERDINMVHRLKDKFATQIEHLSQKEMENIREGEKRSEILEIIIADEGERYKLFGEKTTLSRTSNFDDIVNGVDIILEFVPEKDEVNEDATTEKIALGVDASRNGDTYALEQKINRNINKLTGQNNQKLPGVKYFQSALDKNNKGELKAVIPVVIGLDSKHVNELMSICATLRILSNTKNKENYEELGIDTETRVKELEEKLKNHPAAAVFYRQIVSQLVYYLKILENKKSPLIAGYKKDIDSILRIVKKIKENKKDISIGSYADDEVLAVIEKITTIEK